MIRVARRIVDRMAIRRISAAAYKAKEYDDGDQPVIVKAVTPDAPVIVTAEVAAVLGLQKDPDSDDPSVIMTISTETRDRDRDRISVRGWDLKNFKSNPIVLWAHNRTMPPIARADKIWKDTTEGNRRLRAVKRFAVDANPFAKMIFDLLVGRFLNTASVGFLPLEALPDTPQDGEAETLQVGYLFKRQELLESSIVPIPSNPDALTGAKAKGIDLGPWGTWAEQVLDTREDLIVVSRDQVEACRKQIAVPRVVVPDPIVSVIELIKTMAPSTSCIVRKNARGEIEDLAFDNTSVDADEIRVDGQPIRVA